MATERIPLREAVERWDWSTPVNVTPGGGADKIDDFVIFTGAVLKIMDAVERASASVHKLQLAVDRLVKARADRVRDERLASLARTAAEPTAADAKAVREHNSRRRAWAAYLAAGGVSADGAKLATPVRECGFDVRARRALVRLGCEVLGDVPKLTEDDLLAARNCGSTTVGRIVARLAELGLSLSPRKI